MKYLFSSKLCKLLVAVISLFLIFAFTSCSNDSGSDVETLIGTVSQDNLEVYKKHNADSRVLSQLPLDLEIAIQEEKTVDDTAWGRIDKMTLSDGTKIKSGWIKLEFVRFGNDSIPESTEPAEEIPAETEPAVPPVTVNMGTVTTGKLNIRKDAGSKYDVSGSYVQGDRIEILETKTVDDTLWGRTERGWIGMGYVRMDDDAPKTEEEDVISDGSYTVLGYGCVDLRELNVRQGPGTGYQKVRTVTQTTRFAYYQMEDGWVRIEGGWVSGEYFYLEGTVAEDAVSGTVTTDDLNIRTGPDTSFKSVGTLKKGERVEIMGQVHGWGYTEQGWISMDYVQPEEPLYTTGTGKTTIGLNIRQEPNADSTVVGSYVEGEQITVTEVQGSWGKTDKGWINLKYVKYDN